MEISTIIFIIVVSLFIYDFVVERWLSYLNFKQWDKPLPSEINGIYSEEEYAKAKDYAAANHKMAVLSSILGFVLILGVLFTDAIGILDSFVNATVDSPIYSALLFFAIIGLLSTLLSMPFSLYSTFVIEQKFGFNKTTPKIFILDMIKSILLSAIIGGIIVSIIVKLYLVFGSDFWILAWGVMALLMVFFTMFYSNIIVPLFNKQSPLEDGELRDAISKFATKVDFKLDNIFVIDGSKRSTKANAYFTGLGAKKRIVLYDTLIENHSSDELVAILAHEIGHYKHKHTLVGMVLGLAQSALMLFLLSLFIEPNSLIAEQAASAFGAVPSFHIGVIIFGMLYSPISDITGILMNMLSRKNEYQADAYAAKHASGGDLSKALVTLSEKNLSNLNPHPYFVFVNYSHPPLLFRLRGISNQ